MMNKTKEVSGRAERRISGQVEHGPKGDVETARIRINRAASTCAARELSPIGVRSGSDQSSELNPNGPAPQELV